MKTIEELADGARALHAAIIGAPCCDIFINSRQERGWQAAIGRYETEGATMHAALTALVDKLRARVQGGIAEAERKTAELRGAIEEEDEEAIRRGAKIAAGERAR